MKIQGLKRPSGEELAAEVRERLRGLQPARAVMLRQVMRLHAAADRLMSAHWLSEVARQAPDRPEVLLWQGVLHAEDGAWASAADVLSLTVQQRTDDFSLWRLLGTAQGQSNDAVAAK